jgi:3-hydroxyisobutyrate dehydrogenase
VADVAVLGTGRMGAAMVRRLAGAGHTVHAWNRSPAAVAALVVDLADGEAGAVLAAPSAAAAVAAAEVVLAVLADGDVTRSVLLDIEVLSSLRPGTVVADLGTSGVPAARDLAERLGAQDVPFVDAPVSGSVPAVLGGTLLVMASGDPEVVQRVTPVLSAFARAVLHVGPAGAGQVMKLAVNLVVHDLNAALAESLRLAETSGVSREDAYAVLAESVVAAPFLQYKRAAFLDATTPVAFSLSLVDKDLRLITEHAQAHGAATPVTRAAYLGVRAAVEAGYGPRDMADLSRFDGGPEQTS